MAAVLSVELKLAERGIHALAAILGVPARFFPASRLLAETYRLSGRSEAVFRATGCWGVAEGAALAAAGPGGSLVVAKRKSRRATCAVARAFRPIDAEATGRPRGRLMVVGIGPGDPAWRTPEASAALAQASDIVGYGLYLNLLGPAIAGKSRHAGVLGEEEVRVRLALELAAEGRSVALVSSGDAGIMGWRLWFSSCSTARGNRGGAASRSRSAPASRPCRRPRRGPAPRSATISARFRCPTC